MIRLVASDMDGTLLGQDGRISDRTAQTIRQMRASGCEFVVCTGRGYEDARRPLEEQAIDCDVICMNGAKVCDRTGNAIFKQELSYEQVRAVLTCREPGMLFDFMTNEGSVTISTREEFRRGFEEGIRWRGESRLRSLRASFGLSRRANCLQAISRFSRCL